MRCLFKNSRGEIATILTLISVGLMVAGIVTGSVITQKETRLQPRAGASCSGTDYLCVDPRYGCPIGYNYYTRLTCEQGGVCCKKNPPTPTPTKVQYFIPPTNTPTPTPKQAPTRPPQGPASGCANITEVKTNPAQIKRDQQFKCLVTTSNAAGSSRIACGLSVNGGWPLNICPSDTMFEGWLGNVATFGCKKLDDFSSQIPAGAILEMVGFDFSTGCDPQTGRRIPLQVTGEPTQPPAPTQSGCDTECCGKPDGYIYNHGLEEECDTNYNRWVIIEGICQGQKRSQKRGCATCDNCSNPGERSLQPNSLGRNTCNSNDCPLPTSPPPSQPTATPTLPAGTTSTPTPTGCPAPQPIAGQLPTCSDTQNQDNCADCVIRNRNDVYKHYFEDNSSSWDKNSCLSRSNAIKNWCGETTSPPQNQIDDCNQAKQCHCNTECFGATPTPTPTLDANDIHATISKLVLDNIPRKYQKPDGGQLSNIPDETRPAVKIFYQYDSAGNQRNTNNIYLTSYTPVPKGNDLYKFEIFNPQTDLYINTFYLNSAVLYGTGLPSWTFMKITVENNDYCLKSYLQYPRFPLPPNFNQLTIEMNFNSWNTPDKWIKCTPEENNAFTLSGSGNETIQKAIDEYVNGRISAIQMSFFIAQLTRTPGLQLQYCNPAEPDPNKGGCNFPE